jgi:glyoxylase-like metal-dependent hydrolase (beta-lactamase superfamily II)
MLCKCGNNAALCRSDQLSKTNIITADLRFQGKSQSIAAYLVPHRDGIALVESGPGSTLGALGETLSANGYSFRDITHVFLTHIHLDHAGASGFLASQGASIYVHPLGAPHMLNPEKLIASATRIYGDRMQMLWGDFLPVPSEKLVTVQDGEEIVVGGLRFVALHTPGHANHHCCYIVDDVCFSGDVGGVRIPGYNYLRLPFVPPELNLEIWRASNARLRKAGFKRIAPTHFGIFDDADWHLAQIDLALQAVSAWLERVMLANPSLEELREQFAAWMEEQAVEMGLDAQTTKSFNLANPLGMSADGLLRYWQKVRMAAE